MSPFTAGMRLHDRFVLVEPIGVGRMSQVWRATDEDRDRPVAVKVLAAALGGDPSAQAAAWQEVHAAARLTHPNVTQVYDYGEVPLPDGGHAPYLVMELVEGESLATRLASGALSWPEAAMIGARVAAALAAAHHVSVIHRDLRASKVILTADGVKVRDFGTAALLAAVDREAPPAPSPTSASAGTTGDLATERLADPPAQPASDVHSIGVLLYEAVTADSRAGRRLRRWRRRQRSTGPEDTGPVTLPDLPPEASELLRSCLSTEPARRPPARLVATTLAELADVPEPAASISGGSPALEIPQPVTAGAAAPRPPYAPAGHRRNARSGLRRARRPLLLAGLAAVIPALVVAVAVARSGTEQVGEGGSGPAAAPGSPAETSTPTPPEAFSEPPATRSPPPAKPSPEPAAKPPPGRSPKPDGVLANLTAIDRTIRDAKQGGQVGPGAARRLRDRVRTVTDELSKPDADEQDARVREKVYELEREIDHLERDGEITHAFAAELRTLLDPVSRHV